MKDAFFCRRLDKLRNFLFIIGVHRSGTSALFDTLKKSNQITPSIKKELHYFTPIRFGKSVSQSMDYYSFFQSTSLKTKYLLEASPSYFYGKKDIAEEILMKLGSHTKCILILRNPVDRFISFYNHIRYTAVIDQTISLKKFIDGCLIELEKPIKDNVYSRGLREGCYIDYIIDWHELLGENLKVFFYEELFHSPSDDLNRLYDWLEIEKKSNLFNLNKVNQSRTFKNEYLHKLAMQFNDRYSKNLIENSSLKNKARSLYNFINTSDIETNEKVEQIRYLNDFYASKNTLLKEFFQTQQSELKLPRWLLQR